MLYGNLQERPLLLRHPQRDCHLEARAVYIFFVVFDILASQSVSFEHIFAGFKRMVKSMSQNHQLYHESDMA
ncbi:MAG: hypothetical protein DUD39_15800 [Coriobacteriaceae bacterium]|nr:MAG: hypothetical protein DUD39_15800 [Coriobacteriaceae bacterium]